MAGAIEIGTAQVIWPSDPEEGEELYRRGRELLDKVADLEVAISRRPERLTGMLRVGLSVNISRYIIMPGLAVFMRRHPGLRLQSSVVSQPKELKFYEATHALNAEARWDRFEWLRQQLALKPVARAVVDSVPQVK